MGILKVGVGAAQGVLADSWREYFYCDAMDVDVLAKKGEQRQSKRGFNTKKSENIMMGFYKDWNCWKTIFGIKKISVQRKSQIEKRACRNRFL